MQPEAFPTIRRVGSLLAARRPRRPRSFTVWLNTFVVLTCLAIIGLEAWREGGSYGQALRDAEGEMANLSRSMVQHAEDTIEMADATLVDLVERIETSGTSADALVRLNGVLANHVAALPRLRAFAVFDADGSRIVSSSRAAPGTSYRTRPFFEHHAAVDDDLPYLGAPVRSLATGQWIITLSRRFNAPDGTFGGVAVASIDVGYFTTFYSQFFETASGTITLFRGSGEILARYPASEDTLGRDSSRDPLFTEHVLREPDGTFRFVSPIDGIERVSGYRSGQTYPVVVLAAKNRNEALARWWSELRFRALIVGILVGLIGALGWLLSKQLRRREKAEAQLSVLAATDPLTGLANRRSFDDRLAREWRRAARQGMPLSLLLIDVDRFKPFNDTYGHPAGDACLRRVAEAIARVAQRPDDLAVRYGGEELALLLPDASHPRSLDLAERLRAEIEALNVLHDGNPPAGIITISIGAATLRPAMDDPIGRIDSLVERADRALYAAKQGGRNRVVSAQDLALA